MALSDGKPVSLSATEMDVDKYLLRIGHVTGRPSSPPTLDVLRLVHSCHLRSVPFENLTVHSGGHVLLDLHVLYDKIVNQRRGGFCFENNVLFSWLLSEMGFEVTLLSAQVRDAVTCRYGPPFDHLIVMVTLEGHRWLCDVGFGGWDFHVPVSMETSEPQKQQGQRLYRVTKDEGGMHFLQYKEEEFAEADSDSDSDSDCEWTDFYKFTLEARCREDFVEMCDYHQSSASSFFFCKSLCTVLRPGGRLTYVGYRLITTTFPTEGGGRGIKKIRELKDEEIPGILEEEFGIVLPSPLIPKDEKITPPTTIY